MKRLFITVLICGGAILSAKEPKFNANFSLKNKTKQPITVKVGSQQNISSAVDYKIHDIANSKRKPTNGTYVLNKFMHLNPDRSLALELPRNNVYNLIIDYKGNTGPRSMHAACDLTQADNCHIKFQESKGQFMLDAQEGRFGKTTEGYSLKNNANPNFYVQSSSTFNADDVIDLE